MIDRFASKAVIDLKKPTLTTHQKEKVKLFIRNPSLKP